MLVPPGDSPRPRLVCGDDPDVGGGRTSAERPRDEPPGQPKASIALKPTPGWPGRLHRVVRHPANVPKKGTSTEWRFQGNPTRPKRMQYRPAPRIWDYPEVGIRTSAGKPCQGESQEPRLGAGGPCLPI